MASGSYVLIKPSGEEEAVEVDNELGLDKLQELVGGYIEVVPYFDKYKGQPCQAVVDEEGKLKAKDYNNRATLEWQKSVGPNYPDHLVGNVLILMGSARMT